MTTRSKHGGHIGWMSWPSLYFHSLWLDFRRGRASSDTLLWFEYMDSVCLQYDSHHIHKRNIMTLTCRFDVIIFWYVMYPRGYRANLAHVSITPQRLLRCSEQNCQSDARWTWFAAEVVHDLCVTWIIPFLLLWWQKSLACQSKHTAGNYICYCALGWFVGDFLNTEYYSI